MIDPRSSLEQLLAEADDLLQRALDGGADQADVLLMAARTSTVELEPGVGQRAQQDERTTALVRVWIGPNVAEVSLSELRPRTVLEEIGDLVRRARVAQGQSPCCPIPDGPPPPPRPDLADAALAALDHAGRRELAGAAAAAAATGGPAARSSVRVVDRLAVRALVSSSGFRAAERSTTGHLAATVTVRRGGEHRRGTAHRVVRSFDALCRAAEVVEVAAARARRMLGARRPPSGRWPALWAPGAAEQLLRVVGKRLCDPDGALAPVGSRVAGPAVSVVDDATWPGGPASRGFDDEGVVSRRVCCIDRGVYLRSLGDRAAADEAGLEPSGHALRGPSGGSTVGPTNLLVEPGATPRTQLEQSLGRGLVITGLTAAHGVGGLVGAAEGLWVDSASQRWPVDGFAIEGTALQHLAHIVEAAVEREVHGPVSSPALLSEGVDVVC